MNRILSHILMASLVFGNAGVALAQTEAGVKASVKVNAQASTSGLQRIKEEVKNQANEVRNTIASTSATLREKLEQRLEKKLEKMVERYQATIDRESSILKRIDSRIAKVKSAGGKTEASEKLSLEAKTEIGLATTSLATLKATILNIDNATSSSTASTTGQITKENISKLKKAATEVEKHIRLAHQAMVKAITNLKGMSSVNATSSAEVKAEN